MRLLVAVVVAGITLPVTARTEEPAPSPCDLLEQVHAYFESADGRAALGTLAGAYDVTALQERSSTIRPQIEEFRSAYEPLSRRRGEILLRLDGPEGAAMPPAPRNLDQVMGRLKRIEGIRPRIRYIDTVLMPWLETKRAGAKKRNKVQSRIDRIGSEKNLLLESGRSLEEDLRPLEDELAPLEARLASIRGLEREYEELQGKIARTAAPLVGMNRAQSTVAEAIPLCGEADAARRRAERKAAMMVRMSRVTDAALDATDAEGVPLAPAEARALARNCQCYLFHDTRRTMRDRGLNRDTPEGQGMRDAAYELGISSDCRAPEWSRAEYEKTCPSG